MRANALGLFTEAYRHFMRAVELLVESAVCPVCDDTDPSARLVAPRAQAAPTDPSAQPDELESSSWPQQPGLSPSQSLRVSSFHHQVELRPDQPIHHQVAG